MPVRSAIAGSLSKPSKMPGYSYGLPALTSCRTGSKLAKIEGTGCFKCYACSNFYRMRSVQEAQLKRMNSIADPRWVDEMVAMIGSTQEKYFRWHDSGDLLSIEHLSKLCQIAVRLPEYKFWLPTQEHQIVYDYVSTHGQVPNNLTIRLSTPKIDGRPVTTSLCTSSIHDQKSPQGHPCPARDHGNECGSCRACWDPSIKNVSYPLH